MKIPKNQTRKLNELKNDHSKMLKNSKSNLKTFRDFLFLI